VSLRKFVRLDEAELQEADINKELDLTLDLIRHETKNRIEVVKNYSEIPPIKCYPNMLNQVFMNILVNAAQAIDGVGQIAIDTSFENNSLIVKIKDTGCGIKEPEKIFFAGYTTKGVGVGTGLGLAISQKIIEKHSGKIEVFSKIDTVQTVPKATSVRELCVFWQDENKTFAIKIKKAKINNLFLKINLRIKLYLRFSLLIYS
jgi:signal transduction histidine kinase